MTDYFSQLPREIEEKILSHLDINDICSISLVCKSFELTTRPIRLEKTKQRIQKITKWMRRMEFMFPILNDDERWDFLDKPPNPNPIQPNNNCVYIGRSAGLRPMHGIWPHISINDDIILP